MENSTPETAAETIVTDSTNTGADSTNAPSPTGGTGVRTSEVAEQYAYKVAEQMFQMMSNPEARPANFTWEGFLPTLGDTIRNMIPNAFPDRNSDDIQGVIKEFAVLAAELHWKKLCESVKESEGSGNASP